MTQTKKVDDFLECSSAGFGGDKLGGARHQCWCEPAPYDIPVLCADDGDDCLCNGLVTYGTHPKNKGEKTPGNYYDTMENYYTINDWNNTRNNTCEAKNFEGVDPLPGIDKGCFCDENKLQVDEDSVTMIKDYWRGVLAE